MLSPTGVYATCTVVFIAASVLISLIRVTRRSDERKPINLETLFATGRYHDHVVLDDGEARIAEKIVILDSRLIDTLLAIPL